MDNTQHRQQLTEQQNAALVKLDRSLAELERAGALRVRTTITEVAQAFDLEALKSVVYDIEAALLAYQLSQKELQRLR